MKKLQEILFPVKKLKGIKMKKTDVKYPRKTGIPAKKPL